MLALAGCWTAPPPAPAPAPPRELEVRPCDSFRHAMRGVIARVLDRFKDREGPVTPHTLVGFCAVTRH